MPRMKVLNAVEQEAFDTPPEFNSVQRKQFLNFSSEILRLAAERRTPVNRLHFLPGRSDPVILSMLPSGQELDLIPRISAAMTNKVFVSTKI